MSPTQFHKCFRRINMFSRLSSVTRLVGRNVRCKAIFTAQQQSLSCGSHALRRTDILRGIQLPFGGRSAAAYSDSSSSTPSSSNGDDISPSSSPGDTETGDGGDSQPKVTVTLATGRAKHLKDQYSWDYRRSYTPGDLRQAAQNDEPVYFMLTPPGQPDPGLLQDCYIDTSTLQWLYDPPIGVVSGQLPEHMNLSTVMVLYHPSLSQQQQAAQKQAESSVSAQFHTFHHDYYMFTSYVLPAAQLSIASHPDGDMYPVTFKVTPNPSAMYYEYNSQTLRYAFFETRNGASGQGRVYLAPVPPSPETNNRRLICGKFIPEGTSTPDEFFTFMAFKANITIYVPDLPTL